MTLKQAHEIVLNKATEAFANGETAAMLTEKTRIHNTPTWFYFEAQDVNGRWYVVDRSKSLKAVSLSAARNYQVNH